MERAEMVDGLRALAALLEEHENMPVPYYGVRACLYLTAENARAARKGTHGWTKRNDKDSSFVKYTLGFGHPDDPPVTLSIDVSKNEECTRVQTGVMHVEAQEAYDKPVYEWKCGGDDVEAQ